MIWDSAGYVVPEQLRALMDAASEEERMLKAEVLFGENWETAYREFETNQFFELAGKDYKSFSYGGYWSDDSPAPWLVTSMHWSDVDRRRVEFGFRYTRCMPSHQVFPQSPRGGFSFSAQMLHDDVGTGTITFYPGEYDDRFEQVMMNFERIRSVGIRKDEIAKLAKERAGFIKDILTPGKGNLLQGSPASSKI